MSILTALFLQSCCYWLQPLGHYWWWTFSQSVQKCRCYLSVHHWMVYFHGHVHRQTKKEKVISACNPDKAHRQCHIFRGRRKKVDLHFNSTEAKSFKPLFILRWHTLELINCTETNKNIKERKKKKKGKYVFMIKNIIKNQTNIPCIR